MKRVGRLNGKVIVQGDPNTVTSNQILAKEVGGHIELKERANTGLKNITSSDNCIYFTVSEGADDLIYLPDSVVLRLNYSGKIVMFPTLVGLSIDEKDAAFICYCNHNTDILLPSRGVCTFDEAIKYFAEYGVFIEKVNLQDLI